MKTTTLTIAAASAMLVLSGLGGEGTGGLSAQAADIYGGGLKDAPYTPDRAMWTGWTATVGAGWANHNFDTRRTIDGSLNKYSVDRMGADRLTKRSKYCIPEDNEGEDLTGAIATTFHHCPDGYRRKWADDDYEIDAFTADDTIDPARYEIPLAASHFSRSEELDESGFQGSFELGRRVQNGGIIFEGAIGVSIDATGAASSSYDTEFDLAANPDLPEWKADKIADDCANGKNGCFLNGEGFLSVKKTHDIYAVIGAGVPLGSDQRLAIGVRGGAVLGFFDVKGAHHFDGDIDGDFDTAFSSSENKIGGLIGGYARYKLTNNIDAGLLVSYKAFSKIKAGDSASKDFPSDHCHHCADDEERGLAASVNDRVSIDPSEWAIKGTLTYTFDE